MNPTRGILIEKDKIDEIVNQLDKSLNVSLYDIGFLEGTVDNPTVGEKINGSFSGQSLDVAIRAVAAKCVLFVTKSWEDNGNSIPHFLRCVGGWSEKIDFARKTQHPDWPESFWKLGKWKTRFLN